MLLNTLLPLALLSSTALALPAVAPQSKRDADLEPRAALEARAGQYTTIVSGSIPSNWKLASQRLVAVQSDFYGTYQSCYYTPGSGFSSGYYSCYNYPSSYPQSYRVPLSTNFRGSYNPSTCIQQVTGNVYAPLVGLSDISPGQGDTWCSFGSALLNGASLTNTVGVEVANPCDYGSGPPSPSCGGTGAMQLYYNARQMTSALVNVLPTSSSWAYNLYINVPTNGQPLLSYRSSLAPVTIRGCIDECNGLGFALAGLKGGDTCFCGSQRAHNNFQVSPSAVELPCTGDASTVCGSTDGYMLYRNTAKLDSNFQPINGYEAGGYESSISVASISALSTASSASTASVAAQSQASLLSVASVLSEASIASELSVQSELSTASVASVSATSVAAVAAQSQASVLSAASAMSAASIASELSVQSELSAASATSVAAVSSASLASIASISSVSVAAAQQSAAASTITTTHGFVSDGKCTADLVPERLLNGASFSSDSMTYAACADFCFERGFQVAGVEYARECWCGSSISSSTSSTQCTMACSGDPSVICGGPNALIIFTTTEDPALAQAALSSASSASRASISALSTASVASVSRTSVAAAQQTAASIATTHNFQSNGACYAEVPGRLLTGARTASSSMTYAACADFCFDRGFQAFGVEYSSECFCGQVPESLTYSSQCNMPCSGDDSKICGGPNALYLFTTTDTLAALSASSVASVALTAIPDPPKPSLSAVTLANGFSTDGKCVAEVPGRLLTGPSFASSSMTYEVCSDWCLARGYYAAGVEYASECFCGSTDLAATAAESTSCTMLCAGDETRICGGPNALVVFETTPPSSQPTPTAIPDTDWVNTHVCAAEPSGGRLLTGANTASGQMTPGLCAAFCQERGFDLAGLEYSQECWCASLADVDLSTVPTSTQCTMTCPGSATVCGGPNALTLLTRAA